MRYLLLIVLVLSLSLGSVASIAHADDTGSAQTVQTVAELRAMNAKLAAENAALKKQIAELKPLQDLFGKWKLAEEGNGLTFEFKDDLTYEQHYTQTALSLRGDSVGIRNEKAILHDGANGSKEVELAPVHRFTILGVWSLDAKGALRLKQTSVIDEQAVVDGAEGQTVKGKLTNSEETVSIKLGDDSLSWTVAKGRSVSLVRDK